MPILVFLLLLLCLSCKDADTTIPSSTLITNVQIIDGTGSPAFKGAVRINADKIEAIGNLEALKGEVLIDGKGMVLAPGFIDTHSHHDQDFQQKNRLVPGVFFKRSLPEIASQGVTSIIVGQDGSSNLPIKDFWEQLDSLPVAVNIGSYAGHNSIRKKVMGANYKRPATTEEIQKMKVLIEQEMQAGALGLSTGLEYDPGIYSTPEEVLALTSVLKSYKGRYISHMRSEDRHLETAIDELINIGKTHTIPVQISHFKLARVSLWQKADLILAKLDSARAAGIQVTADIYPYEYWQSTLAVLFPERDFTDLAAAKYALSELTTPEGVIISGFPDSSYIGKTLAEIADL
jgi:N-acyl-D-amino-acid deacylase